MTLRFNVMYTFTKLKQDVKKRIESDVQVINFNEAQEYDKADKLGHGGISTLCHISLAEINSDYNAYLIYTIEIKLIDSIL